MTRRIWWSTWPGALALGLVSFLMVTVTAVPFIAAALLTSADVAGTDITAAEDFGSGWRVSYVVFGLVLLGLPAAVVVVARKKWLGWVLVLLTLSVLILGVALWALGIV